MCLGRVPGFVSLEASRIYRRYGGVGYDFVPAGVVPRLQDAGVPASAIDTMLIRNPARLLTR